MLELMKRRLSCFILEVRVCLFPVMAVSSFQDAWFPFRMRESLKFVWRGDNITKKWRVFKPLLAGRSNSSIDIDGLCAMNVTVVWSLISYHNVLADTTL
jgi:hypothetical protein